MFKGLKVAAIAVAAVAVQGVFGSGSVQAIEVYGGEPFPDVDQNDYYNEAIMYNRIAGNINGYPDGTFKPFSTINRAEFTKILIESLYQPTEFDSFASAGCFPDVAANEWFTKYVCFAKDKQIVNGYGDGTFGPGNQINYVEALKIVMESYAVKRELEFPTATGEWYAKYLNFADKNHLIYADKAMSNAGGFMNRAETAETIFWVDEIMVREDFPSSTFFEQGDVDFQPSRRIPNDIIFKNYKAAIQSSVGADNFKYYHFNLKAYDVGQMKVTCYEDWRYVTINNQCDGPCLRAYVYKVMWNPETGEIIWLNKHNEAVSEVSNWITPLTTDGIDMMLNGITLPQSIEIPGTGEVLTKADDTVAFLDFVVDGYETPANLYTTVDRYLGEVAFEDPVYGEVYTLESGDSSCVYVFSPDGTVTRYVYDNGFFDYNPTDGTLSGSTYSWTGSSVEMNLYEDYQYSYHGCSIQGDCYEVLDAVAVNDLQLSGETSAGVELYTVATSKVSRLNEASLEGATNQNSSANVFLNRVYNDYLVAAEARELTDIATFEEFVAAKSVLFWMDPLGRWSALIGMEFIPPGECGKPVIYLYPEEATDISVKVLIDEFTKTIPDYGKNGWFVNAKPSGEIYNYADGQTYPYLFWEGHKNGNLSPTSGFVVSREELPEFFKNSLARMGLNEQESADFREFWEPRMLDNKEPFFFISFVGTREFNKMAPLEITPTPDTLIRVFMTYHPVTERFEVPKQELKSIPRRGFTVVEWGGTSSRPWKDEI